MPAAEQWYAAYAAGLDELRAALQGCGLRWVYAERMEDTCLATLDSLLAGEISLESWQHGRAFDRRMEIAWWKNAAGWELRAIVAAGAPPAGVSWQALPEGQAATALPEEKLLLFGERQPGQSAWSAVRIPRYLDYPVLLQPPPPRVALAVIPYQVDGLRVVQRLVEVTGGDHE